jgi:hypothetical protein
MGSRGKESRVAVVCGLCRHGLLVQGENQAMRRSSAATFGSMGRGLLLGRQRH